jgi:hypothetical protein
MDIWDLILQVTYEWEDGKAIYATIKRGSTCVVPDLLKIQKAVLFLS